jgi:hypothetical protein
VVSTTPSGTGKPAAVSLARLAAFAPTWSTSVAALSASVNMYVSGLPLGLFTEQTID